MELGSDHRGEKGRGEIREVYLHSQLKHHPPSPGWADITIMMECMPESYHWQSICTPSSVVRAWTTCYWTTNISLLIFPNQILVISAKKLFLKHNKNKF